MMMIILVITHVAAFAGGVWFKFWLDKEVAKANKELAKE